MSEKIRTFQKTVYCTASSAHREFPWRPPLLLPKDDVLDPYKVLVSEIMLQQTQADRVAPKYLSFIEEFPTIQKLSEAKLSEVLKQWQGLGYNRRGMWLFESLALILLVPSSPLRLINTMHLLRPIFAMCIFSIFFRMT